MSFSEKKIFVLAKSINLDEMLPHYQVFKLGIHYKKFSCASVSYYDLLRKPEFCLKFSSLII